MGSAEEPGLLQRHGQGYVESSRGLEDPNLPLWAPTAVQLAPTSQMLGEDELREFRHYGILRCSGRANP